MHFMLMVLVLIVSLIPFPARERYHLPIAHDDEHVLVYQMPYVDIPVIANDTGPGQDNLRVVAVTLAEGEKAEIINGVAVRVYIDWATYLRWHGASAGGPMGRVAHGVYIVSNGYAQSRARWTVWYMPDMRV